MPSKTTVRKSVRKSGALFHVVRNTVRQLRTARAWTQQQLADKMGIHSMDVCRFERGITHQDMKLSRVEAYAQALGVQPSDLLNGKAPAAEPVRAAKPVAKPATKMAAKAPVRGKVAAKKAAPAAKARKPARRGR